MRRLLRDVSVIGMIAGAVAAPASMAQAASSARTFDIPAQDLASALETFGRQSGEDILFDAGKLAGKRSVAIRGRYEAAEALQRLVKGTGVVVRAVNGNSFVVEIVNSATAEADDQGDIVVTGSNIRGTTRQSSPISTYSRDQIERSGYSNIQDFVRAIPQNYGGGSAGSSDDGAIGSGANGGSNAEGGTALNLRGLGASSTLTLVNGQRMAPVAFGAFTDISAIPTVAIERIEIVTDGASAIYGSDAISGVANFILRHGFDGNETSVSFGSVTSGSMQERTVSQLSGRRWGSGSATIALEFQDRDPLPTAERAFTANAPRPTNILNGRTRYSALLNADQTIGANLQVTMDALVSHQDSGVLMTRSTPSSTVEEYTRSTTYNIHSGLKYSMFGDWALSALGGYSEQDTTLRFDRNPNYPILGRKAVFYSDRMYSGDLRADGTLITLPGGPLKIALGGTARQEDAHNLQLAYNTDPRFSRHSNAIFVEANIPIVSPENALPLAREISIVGALRRDHYSDFGNTTNPKLGIQYSPAQGLKFRGTWGTAFRAPSAGELLSQQNSGAQLLGYSLVDNSGRRVPVFILSGSSRQLLPEKAKTWTMGFDIEPARIPGLRISSTYYHVRYTDRLIQPTFDAGALLKAGVYGSLITPLADDAAAAAYLSNFQSLPGTYLDLIGTGAAGVRYIYDISLHNAAIVHQSGVDLDAQYRFSRGADTFSFGGNVAWIKKINTQLTPDSPMQDISNTYGNPLKWRGRLDLDWIRRDFNVSTSVNYSGAYDDTSIVPTGHVASYITIDARASYSPPFIPSANFSISATNLLNAAPPYVNGGVGFSGVHYDVGNASPVGRFVTLAAKFRW